MTDREHSYLTLDRTCHTLERVWATDRDETHLTTTAALIELSARYLERDLARAGLS